MPVVHLQSAKICMHDHWLLFYCRRFVLNLFLFYFALIQLKLQQTPTECVKQQFWHSNRLFLN